MFRLERGATGFGYGKEPELLKFPVRRFRGGCYEAARAAGGAVEQIVERTYPRNFHSAVIVASAHRFAIVCNAIYPWIAFVEAGIGDVAGPGVFVDPPTWAAAFAEMGFVVMKRQLLDSPLNVVDTAALGRGEWLQIRSWRPASVGQTVFNSWD